MSDPGNETNGDDRRRQPRHELMLQVEYLDTKDFLSSWTENVSAGGFFVRTDRPFERGDTLTIKLSFAGLLEPFRVQGRVAWVRPAGPNTAAGIGVAVETERARRQLVRIALQVEQGLATAKPRNTYRILVVDDNEHSQETCRWVLRDVDHHAPGSVEMDFAFDGHEALEILERKRPDLIIADLFMPVMDGISLIKNLRSREQTRSIPVIVVTSGGENERREVEAAGVNAFLQKPVRFSSLLETVVYLIFLLDRQD